MSLDRSELYIWGMMMPGVVFFCTLFPFLPIHLARRARRWNSQYMVSLVAKPGSSLGPQQNEVALWNSVKIFSQMLCSLYISVLSANSGDNFSSFLPFFFFLSVWIRLKNHYRNMVAGLSITRHTVAPVMVQKRYSCLSLDPLLIQIFF